MLLFTARLVFLTVFLGVLLGSTQAQADYTAIYVFGGLLEEIGNNPDLLNRDDRFWPGRMTNGETYVELVSKGLNLGILKPSSEGGTNYAWGPTSGQLPREGDKSVSDQVEEYLAGLGDSGVPDPDALYVVDGDLRWFFGAADDTELKAWATEDAETTISLVRLLAERGAKWFVVLQRVDPTQFLGSQILDATQRSTFDLIRVANQTYNKELGDAIGEATSDGLEVKMVPFTTWVLTASREGLILSYQSAPVGAETEYFNLFGWGGSGSPTAVAHEVLSRIVLETINRSPVVDNTLTDVSFQLGDGALTTSLETPGVFHDEDGDNLTYTVTSRDTSVAKAEIERGRNLILTPGVAGTARITLIASDGAKAADISFQVTVLSTPGTISLTSESADFGEVEVNREATFDLTIQNTGEGPLQISDIQSDISSVSVAETSYTIQAGESQDLKVTLQAGSEGAIAGVLTILSNDPENGTVTVPLTASAVVIPADPRADFNTDNQINLTDFILFVQAFNTDNTTFDLNENGTVDLGDFILFVQAFTRPLL